MVCYENLSGEQLSYLATTIAIAISRGLDANEIELLGTLLDAISAILEILALQRGANNEDFLR